MKEEWRDVVGYEGYYQVSDHGRVRQIGYRKSTSVGKILIPQIYNKYGHGRIHLCVNKCAKYFQLHRLVAYAFIGPPPTPKHEIRHLDGNPKNNRVINLRWGTHKQNGEDIKKHGTANKMHGSKNPGAKLTEHDIKKIRSMLVRDIKQNTIAKQFDVSDALICMIKKGKRWAN